MSEIISAPRVSVGWRICIGEDLCRQMNVSVGDKVVVIRNDEGDIVIRPNKAIA